MNPLSIILDIETLSLRPNALVTEIGVVVFDSITFKESACLFIAPSFFDQIKLGRHICPRTIEFHEQNSTLPNQLGDMPIRDAVNHLCKFIRSHNPHHIWIQGPDFDRPIIEDLCQQVGETLPWRFSRTRDARTVWAIAFPGVKHAPRPHTATEACRATLADLSKALTHLQHPIIPLVTGTGTPSNPLITGPGTPGLTHGAEKNIYPADIGLHPNHVN